MEKRKQRPEEEGGDEGGAERGRSQDEKRHAVTDEEVDEFFNTLLHWRQIWRSFANVRGGSDGAEKKKKERASRREEEGSKAASRWRPTFTLEDFEAVGDGGVNSDGAAAAAKDPIRAWDLDLNAEPVGK